MLSRIAESLYWIGRYVERAEDTARLLDVHYHLLLEDRRADESRGVRRAARRDGRRSRRPSAASRTRRPSPRCSRRTSRSPARSRARSARRGRTHAARARRSRRSCGRRSTPPTARSGAAPAPAPGPRAHEFFGWVRDRAAACNGIVDATMSRDDGWRFFSVGPQPRARRHDDPPAERALRRRLRPHRVDHDPAQLLGVRGVPARVPARGRRRHRGRVPAARPAVPAVGVPRAHHRRQQPRRARSARGARRRRRRSAPAPRPRAAPSSSSCTSTRRWTTSRRCWRGCSTSAPTCTRPSPAGTSARPA